MPQLRGELVSGAGETIISRLGAYDSNQPSNGARKSARDATAVSEQKD
jgi:hypothetical protein